MKARAERQSSDQATLSRRVTSNMESAISATMIDGYSRDFKRYGGLVRYGCSALERDRLLEWKGLLKAFTTHIKMKHVTLDRNFAAIDI